MSGGRSGPSPDPSASRVRVSDKRRRERPAEDVVVSADGALTSEELSESMLVDDAPATGAESESGVAPAEKPHDFLDDLKRLQAEFDNYRKRMLREQTQIAERAGGRLIERLLPVLDNLERALAHGDGGGGLSLIHKELRNVLQGEGLEEIPAAGAVFDPHLHEAVDAREDEGVLEPTVVGVYRTGYKLRDRVLRPAMVVVARPVERTEKASAGDQNASAESNSEAESGS